MSERQVRMRAPASAGGEYAMVPEKDVDHWRKQGAVVAPEQNMGEVMSRKGRENWLANQIDQPSADRGVGRAMLMGGLAGAAQGVADLVEGGKAGAMGSLLHLGDFARRGWNAVAPESLQAERIIDRPENVDAMTPPDSVAGKIGFYGEQGLEYLLPTSLASKAAGKIAPTTQVGSMVVKNPSLLRRAAASGTVMGADAAWAGVQSGGDPSTMAMAAAAPPVIGGAIRAGGALVRSGRGAVAGARDGGFGGAVAGALTGMSDAHPTKMIVQATKPRNSQIRYEQHVDAVAPRVKQVAEERGLPLETLDDVLAATTLAKRQARARFEELAGPVSQMPVDLSPLANAEIASIPRTLALKRPRAYQRKVEEANAFRRTVTHEEAERLLKEANAELDGHYAKFPMGQRKHVLSSPAAAAASARAEALRDIVYGAIDNHPSLQGLPNVARETNREVGRLMEFEDTLLRRRNVAGRQQPESLAQQIAGVNEAAQTAFGAYRVMHGDMSGAAHIVAGRAGKSVANAIKERNSTDGLLRRAFRKVGAADPYAPIPSRAPAGYLERGAIPMGAVADDSYVRGVPAEPAQREVAGYLPASTTASRQFEMPPSSEAAATVEGVAADRVVQRDPRSGQMQRVYTGEEAGAAKQRAESPYTPVLSVMPNAAAQAIPEDPDSDLDNYARNALNLGGAVAIGTTFGPQVKSQLKSLFPHMDAYNKPRGFIKPAKILETIEQGNLPPEVVARAREWVASLKGKPIKPKEIVAQILGEKFDRGRVLRRVSDADAGGRKIAGAPLGITTRRQEKSLVDRYIKMVDEGAHGANWYVDAGRSNMWHSGDNPALADKFGGALAVTSSSTGVPVNTGFGVKGHNQAIAGMEINTGRFPKNMRKPIQDIYGGTVDDIGMKRDPFQQQMAIGGGYATKGDSARAVHDIWQGEAFGYVNPDGTPLRRGFTEAEHRWMDERTREIIDALNARKTGGKTDWNEGSVQAAAWTAAKIRAGQIKPEDAAKSYADYMERYYMQTSRDAVPGLTSEHMPELATMPMDVRKDYAERVANILYDAQGRERSATAKGMLTGGSFEGPGVWKDANGVHVHPGRQVRQVVAPTMDAAGNRVIDDASMKLIKANEAEYGMLMGQDAVAGSFRDDTALKAARDMFDLQLPSGTLQMSDPLLSNPRIGAALQADQIALIPTDGGARILNIGMSPDDFAAFMKATMKDTGGASAPGRNLGFYESNRWGVPEGRAGQDYARIIQDVPTGVDNFNKTAPDVARQLNALDREMQQRHGVTLNDTVMQLREAIAAKGFDGVRELAARYGAPLAAFLLLARTSGLLPEEAQ